MTQDITPLRIREIHYFGAQTAAHMGGNMETLAVLVRPSIVRII